MYRFIKTKDPTNKDDYVDLEMNVKNEDITWFDLMERFVEFLRGCSYVIGEGRFVLDNELPGYVDSKTAVALQELVYTLIKEGKTNELLVHPNSVVREYAAVAKREISF